MNVLKKIKNSSEGKTLAKNFVYLFLLQIASYIFPFITLPYLARVIGVDYFGKIAIGAAIVAYFQSIVDYSFNYSSVKEIARNKHDKERVSKIVSTTIAAKIFLMLISIILLFAMIELIPYMNVHRKVILVTFLLIPGQVLFMDWYFQAIEDMKYITILSVVSKLFFTIMIFFCIKDKSDYLLQPILTAGGYILSGIACVVIMQMKFEFKFIMPSFKEVIKTIKEGRSMFLSLFLPTIYTNLNTLILGAFKGNTATGIYNGASKFTSLSYSFFLLISRTCYPFFARRMDKHKTYVVFSLTIATIISLVLFFFARSLVYLLLGPEFEEAIIVLKIVAFTPIAMSLMNSYGFNCLVLKGREDIMRNIVISITILGLFLGIGGTILWSYIGVAVASLVTQLLRSLLVTYYALKIK